MSLSHSCLVFPLSLYHFFSCFRTLPYAHFLSHSACHTLPLTLVIFINLLLSHSLSSSQSTSSSFSPYLSFSLYYFLSLYLLYSLPFYLFICRFFFFLLSTYSLHLTYPLLSTYFLHSSSCSLSLSLLFSAFFHSLSFYLSALPSSLCLAHPLRGLCLARTSSSLLTMGLAKDQVINRPVCDSRCVCAVCTTLCEIFIA